MSFETFCTSATVVSSTPHASSLLLLDSLRCFVQDQLRDRKLCIKDSLKRDGTSISTLLRNIRELNVALLAIEKNAGCVFGCCTNTQLKNKKLTVLCRKLKIN